MICTQDELASVFGVSVPTIQAWQAAGMPYKKAERRGKANEYETGRCIEWRTSQLVAKAEESSGDARLKMLKVAREEIALRREVGELVNAEEVARILDRYVSDANNIIDGLPERYAVVIQQAQDGPAQHAALQRLAREVREALADLADAVAAAPAGTGDTDRGGDAQDRRAGAREVSAAA